MPDSHCPICYGPLEVRDVAPCWNCGHDPAELDHLKAGRHKFAELRLQDAYIVLCDFCQLDFWSFDPAYFGRNPEFRPGKNLILVRDVVNPAVAKDKYC